MKKKYYMTAILSVSLLLGGCGKKQDASANSATANPTTQTQTAADTTTQQQTPGTTTSTTTSFDKQVMDNLIENSDYISKVRVQVVNSSGIETNFIADYRGDLSALDITLPKSLTPGREYLVFYHDDTDGKITPTRGDDSFIEIQDDNDQSLQYIEKKFPVPESVNPEGTNSTAQKTTTTSESKSSTSSKSSTTSKKDEKSLSKNDKQTSKSSDNSSSTSTKNTSSTTSGKE